MFRLLEREGFDFPRWNDGWCPSNGDRRIDRSLINIKIRRSDPSSLESRSSIWHSNHLWRCGAADITGITSSWKPARHTCGCTSRFLLDIVWSRGDLWSWTGWSKSKSSMIRDFCSMVRALARGCSPMVYSCDMWHEGVRRVWWEKGLVATTKDSSDGMTLPPLDVLTLSRR